MKKVLLLLAEGFETYEASVFIDVIGWNLIIGDGSTKLFCIAYLSVSVKLVLNQLQRDVLNISYCFANTES
jgi:4-methyl-5(b-hydroxyethyl)-thiazole monophosphate biosynthesis